MVTCTKNKKLVSCKTFRLTVGKNAPSIGRTFRKNHRLSQVLEHGNSENSRVLVRGEILLLVITVLVGLEPGLHAHVEEHKDLNGQDDEHVTEERDDGSPGHQLVRGRLMMQLREGFGVREEEGHDGDQEEVNVEELEVGDAGVYAVEDDN